MIIMIIVKILAVPCPRPPGESPSSTPREWRIDFPGTKEGKPLLLIQYEYST